MIQRSYSIISPEQTGKFTFSFYDYKTKINDVGGVNYETLNIVIEFYGNYFHLNPEKYSPDFIQYKNHEKCVKAKDRWQHDKERIDDIQQTLNCKVIIVWESTYRNDKKGTIKSLIQMINNKEQLNDITEI